MSDLLWAFVFSLIYAGANWGLHWRGPQVRLPEFYARPIYYGVGFTTFMVCAGAWAWVTGHGAEWLAFAIIGGGGGLGMLAAYTVHATRMERSAVEDVDTALSEGD